ncbi:LytR/AlgR family response regulator transcription factor [Eubacterium aggregans]|nr:LytTR family DNA-binding domain-containing protein [Eubacterium aggregans]MDD4691851.1 LytTR family DNA-binding domain-containing protein [Eubacterium aggregans]
MMRIAVCDDNIEDLKWMCQTVRTAQESLKIRPAGLSVFEGGGALMEKLQEGQTFDLYFLDLLMPDIHGIDLGQQIRLGDERADIAYTTSSPEFALDAYSVHALDYLIKPVEQEKVVYVLKRVAKRLAQDEKKFCLHIRGDKLEVPMNQICYAENVSRCVNLVLAGGNRLVGVTNRSSFETSVASLLEAPGFVQCHKSFVVNLLYVNDFMGDSLFLDNGQRIPVSRSQVTPVRRVWLAYAAARGMGDG